MPLVVVARGDQRLGSAGRSDARPPGGRLVFVDPNPRRSPEQPAVSWGVPWYDEADHRRLFEDAGFTDVTVRYQGLEPLYEAGLVLGCRRPGAPSGNAAADVADQLEPAGSAAPA
jgi:hypothetical protein